MLITLGSSTDLGRRESNQDSVLAVLAQNLLPRKQSGGGPPRRGAAARRAVVPASAYVQSSALLILADGMGGRASGQLASETATKSVYRELAHTLAMQEGVDAAYLEKSLAGAIQQANGRIHALSLNNVETEGMGTTCTAALVMRDLICLGHVGDSRAYLLAGLEEEDYFEGVRARARFDLLTADHSVVASEVRAGRLTEEEARRSRFRNVITRAVGVDQDVQPDVITRPVPLGLISHLVLTSDGLHGSLDEDAMEEILRHHARAPQRAANALVSAAKRAGATDNISVIVARIDATGENYKEGAAPIDFEAEEEGEDAEEAPANLAARDGSAGFWSRPIVWQIGCAVLALVAIAAWLVLGLFRPATPVSHPALPAPVPSAPAPAAPKLLTNVAYGSPQTLLSGRVLSPSVLELLPGVPPAQGNLLVIDPKARRMLRVSSSDGLVSTSVAEPSFYDEPEDNLSSWEPMAADASGDVYLFAVQSKQWELRKYDSDGKFLTAAAQGQLSHPTAIAIAPPGDIFIIDGGILKRIPVIQNAPVASAVSNSPTASSASQ